MSPLPKTIEVDLLFPRNEIYNNMTGFPIVFALQNADAAGKSGWDIDWQSTWLEEAKTISSSTPILARNKSTPWP
ncbi:hypothetical protein BDV09DRAFT_169961 [Aspergillus tetrazonus]